MIFWNNIGVLLITVIGRAMLVFAVPGPCEIRQDDSGIITYSMQVHTGAKEKCWTIVVPPFKLARVAFTALNLGGTYCTSSKITIIDDGNENRTLVPGGSTQTFEFLEHNVTIQYYGYNPYGVQYTCSHNFAFTYSLEYGLKSLAGFKPNRLNGVSWLKKRRNPKSGWDGDTHRAITALYLADGASFNDSNDEANVMAMALKNQVMEEFIEKDSSDVFFFNRLGMYINALLVACYDPRLFISKDLVDILQKDVNALTRTTHPIASLALCNAKASLEEKAIQRLADILETTSMYAYMTDVKAMAMMAMVCLNNSGNYTESKVAIEDAIKTGIAHFLSLQKNGAFGNIYTTAVVTQALLASGQWENEKWQVNETIKYLVNQQKNDSSFGDQTASFLILPILNGKSLTDIGKVNCPVKRSVKPKDKMGSVSNKIFVKYSLFIGDGKEVNHIIVLRVPLTTKVFDLMELAKAADQKYRFLWEKVSDKINVYSIAGLPNDPEAGKYWLLHLQQSGKEDMIVQTTESSDRLYVKDNVNVVMWYKTLSV